MPRKRRVIEEENALINKYLGEVLYGNSVTAEDSALVVLSKFDVVYEQVKNGNIPNDLEMVEDAIQEEKSRFAKRIEAIGILTRRIEKAINEYKRQKEKIDRLENLIKQWNELSNYQTMPIEGK